jgi:dienelactone hydrolase
VEQDAAERFRSVGFELAVPDLYAGKRTESLEEGFRLMAEIGWPVICRRAFEAIKELPQTTILAGFSMGAGVISSLWGERTRCKAVLLFRGLAEIPSNGYQFEMVLLVMCLSDDSLSNLTSASLRDCTNAVLDLRWIFLRIRAVR